MFCLAGNLILAIVALISFPTEVLHVIQAQVGDVSTLGIMAAIIWGRWPLVWWWRGTVFASSSRCLPRSPLAMRVRSSFEVGSAPLGFGAREIQSIETGGWTDPNHAQVTIRHEEGTIRFFNQFTDFKDLLMAIKVLNPQLRSKGFDRAIHRVRVGP